MSKWWGYRHINGTIQVKRYLDKRNVYEAKESPFIDKVFGPFEASDKRHAYETAVQLSMAKK